MDQNRDDAGRFGQGNRFGRGGGVAAQMAHRAALLRNAITDEEVTELGRSLLKRAMSGSIAAAELLLRYVCGAPDHADLVERVDQLEARRKR